MNNELLAALVSVGQTLTNAMSDVPGFMPCDHAFAELVAGAGLLEGGDATAVIEAARAKAEHVSDHRGVEKGAAIVSADAATAEARGQLIDAIRTVAAGELGPEQFVFLANAFAALGHDGNADELAALLARVR